MPIHDRITVSAEDIFNRLDRFMDRLHHFRYDSKYQNLLGKSVLSHMEFWDDAIRSRRKDPFTLVVAGEFKRGKSSFINALLGENILPTDVTPETMTVNKLLYGPHKNEAILSGGRRMSLDDGELHRASLERIIAETGESVRHIELWRPNERLQDIRIFDTPGLNDVSEDAAPLVGDALTQADAVIYIYNYSYPLSRSEQMFVKYSILPQNYTKVFLVCNWADIAGTKDNLLRMTMEIKKRTQILLSEEPSYMISALDELSRISGAPRPQEELAPVLEQGFSQLRGDIETLISAKKSVIAADRVTHLAHVMIREVADDLIHLEEGMKMDISRLASERQNLEAKKSAHISALAEAQEKVEQLAKRMEDDTLGWITKLLENLRQENLSEYSTEDIYQYYSYYCIDVIQGAVRACLEQHRENMLDEMSKISDGLSVNLAGVFPTNDKLTFRFALDNNTWTNGDSITLAITTFSGNDFINTLADLVGSMFKQNQVNKETLIENIKRKYPALRAEVERFVTEQYQSLAEAAKNLLASHYKDLIDRAESVVMVYTESAKKSEEEKVRVRDAIAEVRNVLSAFQQNEENAFYGRIRSV